METTPEIINIPIGITPDDKLSKKDIALAKAGATRELAYRTLVDACSATTVRYDRDGDCIGEQPDYATRVKAAESISRLNGDLKETPLVVIDHKTINISDEAFGQLLHMVKDVSVQLVALRTNGQQTGEIIDIETS